MNRRISFLALTSLCFFPILFSTWTSAQDTSDERLKVAKLIGQLASAKREKRLAISDQIFKSGAVAVKDLFAAIENIKLEREIRYRCELILLRLANQENKNIQKVLKEHLVQIDFQKSPARATLIKLRTKLLGEIHISEKEAISRMQKSGINVWSGDATIEISNQTFKGSLKPFRNITAIKSPISLTFSMQSLAESLDFFELLPQCNLKSFKIADLSRKGLTKKQSIRFMSILRKCEKLTSLALDNSFIDEKVLPEIEKLTQLESIDLPGPVSDDLMERLSRMPKLHTLRFFSPLQKAFTKTGLKHLVKLKSLKTLNLRGLRLETDIFPDIAKLKQIENLVVPQISTNDDAMKHLCKLVNLKKLTINNTLVTDAGFKHLTKLKKLKHLSVGGETPITDRSVKTINSISSLNRLFINATMMTEQGIDAIRIPVGQNVMASDHRSRYFEPKDKNQYRMIQDLIDKTFVIRRNHLGQLVVFLYDPQVEKHLDHFEKLKDLNIGRVYLNIKPSKELVTKLQQLDQKTSISLLKKSITDKTANAFKNRFIDVYDGRKNKE